MADTILTRRQLIKQGGFVLTTLVSTIPLKSAPKSDLTKATSIQKKNVFKIESFQTVLLTREELNLSQWASKFDRFISVTGFQEDDQLLKSLSFEYDLNAIQIAEIQKCIGNDTVKCHRLFNSKEEFKIEPIYLDIINTTGTLIYWKDWDYIFQKIGDEYFLWCFLGGIADMQREIKLSTTQMDEYRKLGFQHIDNLVKNIKTLNYSSEYELAKKENRKVL